MNPIQTYLSSLQSKKPAYGSLFSTPAMKTNLAPTAPATPNMSMMPKQPTQSATPSSTSPTPTVITPPTKTNTGTSGSSAKSTYISTLAGNTGGTQTQNPAGNTGSNPINPGGTPADTGGSTDPLKSYRDYLAQYATSLKPSDEIAAASTKLADVQNKIDERTLKSRREYEEALKKEGGLKAGNEASARALERQNASELADLGVAEGGAARTLMALTGVKTSESEAIKALLDMSKPMQMGDSYIDPTTGKTVYSKPKEGITLSQGQTRYELDPVTGKYKEVASVAPKADGSGISTSGGTYTAGANPTVDAWANRIQSGQAKITDIPAASKDLRNAVTVALDAMGNSADGKPTTTEIGKQALSTAKDLMKKFESGGGYNNAVGGSSLLNAVALPGTQRSDFKISFQSLKDQLSLDAVKLLKGQGAVSDAERALLASAVTKLNLAQSEDEFKATLKEVIDKLEGNAGSTAGVLRSPDGLQEVSVSDLSPAELAEAKAAGWK